MIEDHLSYWTILNAGNTPLIVKFCWDAKRQMDFFQVLSIKHAPVYCILLLCCTELHKCAQ
jgi:hypothetical protein